MTSGFGRTWIVLLVLGAFAPACSDGGEEDDGGGAATGGRAGTGEDARSPEQFPPTSAAEVAAWLDAGHYLSWLCEDEPTPKTEGSPAIHVHGGTSRVCSNALLAASPGGDAFPAGVAAVKELFDAKGTQTGRAVYAKVQADSDGGNGWFWWENGSGGLGIKGCTGCHSAAGSDADHPGAGDYVYFKL